jgi:ubiquinone biosynthesis protein
VSDLAIGAFTEEGPWELDPAACRWLADVDAERARMRRELPGMLTPSRLPPVGPFARTVSSIGRALLPWYLVDRRRGRQRSRASVSRRLRRAFERLGPTYIKLGQIVSSGEGLFPEELVGEFKLLRDRVPPEPFDAVRRVVETDLGRSLDSVFRYFAREPIAAASIAQVHAATLVTGEQVVVKVQRPQVARRVRRDVAAMAWLAPHLVGRIPVAALGNPPALVELFAETIVEELDFRLEAQNMLDIARVLAETNQRAIVVPRPHPELVTRRVLVMERLSGFSFDDVESMHAAGIDTTALVRAGLIAFLEGAMLYGVFHGDLHGGNLFVMPDGRTVLVDFGITGRLDEPRRLAFLRLLVHGTAGDVRGQLTALRDMGAFPADTDLDAAVVDLGLDQPVVDPTTLSADQLTSELREITKKLLGYGARMPKELMLFVKNMIFLDGAIARLAPDLDLLAEIVHVHLYFAQTHGDRIVREAGLDPTRSGDLDIDAVKASMGLTADVERLTYRDVQARRDIIRRRMQEGKEQRRRTRRLGHRGP